MVDLGADWLLAEEAYREAFGSLTETIVRFRVAELPGVGTFSARCLHRPAYQAVNPFTRQPITCAARDLLRFRFAPDPLLLSAIDAKATGAPPAGSLGLLGDAFLKGLTSRWPEIKLPIGVFRVIKLPAQRVRLNPRTGAVIAPGLPARRDVRFRPSRGLKTTLIAALRETPE
jgi:nucleoid DNA-binding protein